MRITKLRYGRQICAPVDYLDRACAVKFHDPCKFIDAVRLRFASSRLRRGSLMLYDDLRND